MGRGCRPGYPALPPRWDPASGEARGSEGCRLDGLVPKTALLIVRRGAVVDFDDAVSEIANIGTSTGGKMFGDELDATVFQFPKVQTIVYTLAGNCEAFTEIFQSSGCPPSKRPLRPTIIPVG